MTPLPRELIHAVPWPEELRYDTSPIQCGLGGSPWHVTVSSVLLQRARRKAPVLQDMFESWSTPELMACSITEDLEEVLHPLGLHRNRARFLQQLSNKWFTESWSDLRDLNGVGLYVADAVGLFCFGCTALDSTDGVLEQFASKYQGPTLVSMDGLYQVGVHLYKSPVDAYKAYKECIDASA